MPYFRKIVGERIYLSPFNPEDVNIIGKWTEWMNDKAVSGFYGGHHNNISLASVKKMFDEFGGHRFDIMALDGDQPIGHISLHDIDHLHRNAFIGIIIGEDAYRNKGYGTEAVRLILEYAFKTMNLHNIMLSVHSDNYAGIACYKKVGFREVGRCREWIFKDGEYIDKIYMDILENEFKS